jgi:hypothetical protein
MSELEEAFSLPHEDRLFDLVYARTRSGVEAVRSRSGEVAAASAGDLVFLLACAAPRRRKEVARAAALALATIYATTGADDSLQFEVALGVVGMGGLAVRLENWPLLRTLAMLPSGRRRESREPPYLIPDARLRSARQRRIGDENTLIDLARKWAGPHDLVRPDLPADDERVLDSLCQFNAFATMIQIDRAGTEAGFPEFRRYEARRTDPAFEAVISDPTVRDQLLPGVDDRRLGELISEVITMHATYFHGFNGWTGFESRAVVDFLKALA